MLLRAKLVFYRDFYADFASGSIDAAIQNAIIDEDVPISDTEDDNKIVKEYGERMESSFTKALP